MYSTLENAFIVDLDGGGMVKLQFIPDTITDSKRAQFTDYVILGRSSPLKGYQYSPSRTIEFVAVFHASPTEQSPLPLPFQIKQTVDWLRGLAYPDYRGGIMPPHRCFVQIGENIKMKCVCTGVSPTYSRPNMWELGPGYAHGVAVSLTFEEIADVPLDVNDVRGGAY